MKPKPDGTDCPPDAAKRGDGQLKAGVYGVSPKLAALRNALAARHAAEIPKEQRKPAPRIYIPEWAKQHVAKIPKGPRTPAPLVGPKPKPMTQCGLDVMLWPTVRGWLKKAGNARAKTEWDAHRDRRRLLVSLALVAIWRPQRNDAKCFRGYIETTAPAMTDLIPTLRRRLEKITKSEFQDATQNHTESRSTAAATKTRAANRAACRDLPPFLRESQKKTIPHR